MVTLSALPSQYLILDACCAITLHESGQMGSIMAAMGKRLAIATYVLEKEIVKADLQPFIESGQLEAISPEGEDEMNAYVDFAADLDDGEAVTGAIAVNRGWAMATDELKAITFFAKAAPDLAIVTTPDLIKTWVDSAVPPDEMIRAAVRDIRTRAKYVPGPKHSLRNWWISFT